MSNFTRPHWDLSYSHTLNLLDESPELILLGAFLQCFLQGIILVSAAKYWHTYQDDPRARRIFIAVLVFLSFGQTAVEDYKSWRVAVYRKSWATSRVPWIDIFLNGLICSLSELYLLGRCWELTNKNYKILIPLWFLAFTTLVCNVIIDVTIGIVTTRAQEIDIDPNKEMNLMPLAAAIFTYWTTVSLFLDVVTAAILMSFLWRSRTGLRYLDKALWSFLAIATESALWPALCMLLTVSLYHSPSTASNRVTLFFFLLTGKFYTLSILRTLNARAKLRARMKSHDLGRVSLGDWQWEQATDEPGLMNAPSSIRPSAPSEAPISPLDVTSESNNLASVAQRIGEVPRDIQPSSPNVAGMHVHEMVLRRMGSL